MSWSTQFQYDGKGRVIEKLRVSSSGLDKSTERYEYDRNGNKISQSHSSWHGDSQITYQYDDNNRLTKESMENCETFYQYDEAGKLTEKNEHYTRIGYYQYLSLITNMMKQAI